MARKEDLVTPDMGAVDSDNPNGKYLNKDTGVPGTPALAQEMNSKLNFFARIMAGGGLSYNGDVDTFTDSQFFDAFINILNGGVAVDKWDSTEAALYEAAGYIVQDSGGKHYASTGKANNLNKNPADPANIEYWFPSPGAAVLEHHAKSGNVIFSMHPFTDRAGALFDDYLYLDKIQKGATEYDLVAVMLDGATVTGDSDLEALINSHPYADIFAPDALGTRTLIDMGEHAVVGQSDSGESDTMGEVQEDRGQGHRHKVLGSFGTLVGINAANIPPAGLTNTSGEYDAFVRSMVTDGINGTPRIGKTTRGNQLVNGCGYIISMIPAT